MLYNSLSQSIAAYNVKKKQMETYEDRILFRWKIITLSIFIVLIGLIAVFTQLFRDANDIKVNEFNSSFLPDLLNSTSTIQTDEEILNMLHGLNASQNIIFDKAEKITEQSTVRSKDFQDTIYNKNNLLYLFKTTNNLFFGMFLRKQYDNDFEYNNEVLVVEGRSNKQSSMFNLNLHSAMKFSYAQECAIYRYNQGSTMMSLLEIFSFDQAATDNLFLRVDQENYKCFGSTTASATQKIASLTSADVIYNETLVLEIDSLEVYQLTFSD